MILKNHVIVRDGTGYLAEHPHLKAHLVAQMHIHGGISVPDVATHYQIDIADVYAAIAYYYDNAEEIERAIEAKLQLAREIGGDRFQEN